MRKFYFLLIVTLGVTFSQDLKFLEDPDTIELYRASSTEMTHYGTQIFKSYLLKTSTKHTNSTVSIHHEMVDGTWEDIPATQIDEWAEEDRKYQMWKAEIMWISSESKPYSYGKSFVVKFTTHHCIQWDNNELMNYQHEIHSGPMLGKNVYLSMYYANLNHYDYDNATRINAGLYVKNLSYDKKVFALFSTDKFKTSERIEAFYSPSFMSSYGPEIPSPNSYGVELWTIDQIIAKGKLEEIDIMFGYETSGVTYWDNNFGRTYHIKVYSS